MRRDTQIGIILGIVILVIIGVFLSTRTNDNEPQVSDLVLSSSSSQQHEIEEIDINELIEKSEADRMIENESKETSTNKYKANNETVKAIHKDKKSKEADPTQNDNSIETHDYNTTLKGKWEGIVENKLERPRITDNPQIAEEIQFTEEQISNDESLVMEEITYDEVEEISSEDKRHVASAVTAATTIHKVRPNDNLFKISKKYFGDESKWDRIFQANKDIVPNPHSLYVGQELLIPDYKVEKPGSKAPGIKVVEKSEHKTKNTIKHTVQPGDTLYQIAGKYYDNPRMWEKIYKANEESIEDKGLLRKGQILIIPQ